MAEFIKVNGQEYPATLIYNYVPTDKCATLA